MSIVLVGSTSGSITLQEPAVAGTTVLDLPATSGTVATLTTPSFATTIGVGGATPSTSGAGITFPASQSASSDANTLDDYEEGTWTPTIVGNSTAGTASYSQQTGYYTKVGNVVTVGLYVNFSSATGTGVLNISGLPFSSNASALVTGSLMTGNIDWPSGTTMATLYKPPNGAYFEIYCSADNSGWLQLQMDSAGEFLAGCTYFV